MPPYDPDKHPTPPWTWQPDPAWGDAGGYWKLDDSEGMADDTGGHSCDCAQYVLAKIQGRSPTRADEADPGKLAPLLLGLGYTAVDCERCGCGQGQCTDCVVIYSRDGRAFHAAAFDRVLCDWGGKRNAALGSSGTGGRATTSARTTPWSATAGGRPARTSATSI